MTDQAPPLSDPFTPEQLAHFAENPAAHFETDYQKRLWATIEFQQRALATAGSTLTKLDRTTAELSDANMALTSSLERCREALTLSENALACFLETPEFVVTVGGNPIVVDGMLSMSRTALTKTREALSLTKKE